MNNNLENKVWYFDGHGELQKVDGYVHEINLVDYTLSDNIGYGWTEVSTYVNPDKLVVKEYRTPKGLLWIAGKDERERLFILNNCLYLDLHFEIECYDREITHRNEAIMELAYRKLSSLVMERLKDKILFSTKPSHKTPNYQTITAHL